MCPFLGGCGGTRGSAGEVFGLGAFVLKGVLMGCFLRGVLVWIFFYSWLMFLYILGIDVTIIKGFSIILEIMRCNASEVFSPGAFLLEALM